MNWLLIVVILIIAGHMVAGYRKGFLRVAYSLVEWLLVLVFVTWAGPYVGDFLMNHTQIPGYIESHCMERLKDSVNPQAEMTNSSEALEAFGITLPDNIAEKLFGSSEEKITEAFSSTGEITDRILEESGVYEMIAQKITKLAINGLAYLITLIVAGIVFHLIGNALHVVNKIPLIGGANQMLGFVAGALEGLLFIWVFFAVVAACAGTGWGRFVITYIAEAPVLAWLYQNNLLITILVAILFK